MRIVLFASGDFAVPTMRSLVGPGSHAIVGVVSQPDRGAGRGRRDTPTPVKAEALRLGLEVITTDNVNAPEMIERVRDFNADLGLAIAFGQKIGPDVRGLFPHQCINLHASLLPKYRGAAPFQWAIINGEERTGVTVFRLVDRMDAGPIYTTRWTAIRPEERACELHDRLAQVGVDAVQGALEAIAADPPAEPVPQDDTLATRAPRLTKQDGLLHFDEPADRLACRINGLWSWPGAQCYYDSADGSRRERVTLAMARVGDLSPADLPPGTLDERLYVATGSGFLEILEIRPENSRVMNMQDFVNGRHVQPGDRLQSIESDQQ